VILACKKHGPYSTDDPSKPNPCHKCEKEEKNSPPAPHAGKVVIGGLDLGKYHDYSALVVIEVENQVAIPMAPKVWPHVDYHVVVADTVEIYKRRALRMLAIDATGVGAPISEMFWTRGVKTEDIKFGEYVDYTSPWGSHERAPVKYAMMEFARACLQEGKVKFPKRGLEDLIQQLQEQQLIVGPTDRPTYQHPEGKHDDLAWAFLMALYTARPYITGNGIVAIRAY